MASTEISTQKESQEQPTDSPSLNSLQLSAGLSFRDAVFSPQSGKKEKGQPQMSQEQFVEALNERVMKLQECADSLNSSFVFSRTTDVLGAMIFSGLRKEVQSGVGDLLNEVGEVKRTIGNWPKGLELSVVLRGGGNTTKNISPAEYLRLVDKSIGFFEQWSTPEKFLEREKKYFGKRAVEGASFVTGFGEKDIEHHPIAAGVLVATDLATWFTPGKGSARALEECIRRAPKAKAEELFAIFNRANKELAEIPDVVAELGSGITPRAIASAEDIVEFIGRSVSLSGSNQNVGAAVRSVVAKAISDVREVIDPIFQVVKELENVVLLIDRQITAKIGGILKNQSNTVTQFLKEIPIQDYWKRTSDTIDSLLRSLE